MDGDCNPAILTKFASLFTSMKLKIGFVVWLFSLTVGYAQELIIPAGAIRPNIFEGDTISFYVTASDSLKPRTFILDGVNGYGMQIDTAGHFTWTPAFDFVDRLEKQKEVSVIVQAEWRDGRRARTPVSFLINHKNRPPVVEDLPVFYVKQATANQYQISSDYVSDPDGDPLVFKSIQSQMPEGAALTSQGLFSWAPSRNQFNSLKKDPIVLEFIVQDQPEKAETKGKIRIAQTQLDLPPEILLVPGDTAISIKEDEVINLRLYVSDPNGDENIATVGFVCSDTRVPSSSLKSNTSVQWEFTWSPGYYFVEEAEKSRKVEMIFFALDKSNNRTQRKVNVTVADAENLDEKDKASFQKYKNSLSRAKILIDQLDDNHETLNKAYKKAKKGKKNRSILNASLGAVTGLSPVVLPTDESKVVAGVGGTTVLTLGTLEATEVIGKSKSDILEKIKINVELRNQLQIEGDNFARKYALKSARRSKEFEIDREKLLPIVNNQKLVMLELDANRPAYKVYSNSELKKTFPDFAEE